ncbi:DEAD/DEAH box helicase [Cyclobacterium marinum]|uniref:DEAD/DEAH box helicase domain protein n=1 Tax=Cyclobacterium marinum (strain ATCC 25205 / DSM 745 / LMG 13164 / NCIMB 1802) TaxID=880070 RepID=G0J2P0_CYCMS|nr:DEAD/DEAH box helicase [Cyclobacterium marinum]AEL26623.1 DEAD/DEAH box helicase domain protein [Cyclobacterium marinum DSM 745]MBR9774851.1 DEAD/DEAH box helicase [Cytophagales bacterium]|tara:strand:- start:8784 stop:9920 length:1137 start_codon:yes stop_codon:yes gene_type:complete
MSFAKLKLHPTLLENISSLGYTTPTPIQEQAIPVIIQGKDLLGIAKTGSGKTVSYVAPIINHLIGGKQAKKSRQPKVLVLVPSRELAIQVVEVFKELSLKSPIPVKSMAVYGGVSINPQMKGLFGVDILVATPGRLLDLQSSAAIDLSKVSTLVLDEADKMLNLGFHKEMEEIFDLLPKKRQNLLFSATLSDQLSGINRVLLLDPVVVKVEDKVEDVESINLSGYFVSDEKKGPLLRHLIKENDMKQVLIFTSSGIKADKVANKLQKNGIPALSIHGKKSQFARLKALDQFKSGETPVLVATDLIARGIDFLKLPYVINYELPRSPKDFVHRVGRTGRAKEEGLAISFVTREEIHHFKVILKKMKRFINMVDSETMDL